MKDFTEGVFPEPDCFGHFENAVRCADCECAFSDECFKATVINMLREIIKRLDHELS